MLFVAVAEPGVKAIYMRPQTEVCLPTQPHHGMIAPHLANLESRILF